MTTISNNPAPLFEHDWDNCEYLGTYYRHDVYIYRHKDVRDGPDLVARFGNKPSDYLSYRALHFFRHLISSDKIGGTDEVKAQDGTVKKVHWVMPFIDWIVSDRKCPGTTAILVGLAIYTLKKETRDSHGP